MEKLDNGYSMTIVENRNRWKAIKCEINSHIHISILTGLKVLNAPCCKLLTGIVGVCLPGKVPCEDRDDYVFWDGYHTTEVVNKIIANNSYNAMSPDGVYPINIAQLAQLQI